MLIQILINILILLNKISLKLKSKKAQIIKKIITNAPKKVATKPSYFSKAKKPIVKAILNEPIEAAKAIAKTVHCENNAVAKAPSSKK